MLTKQFFYYRIFKLIKIIKLSIIYIKKYKMVINLMASTTNKNEECNLFKNQKICDDGYFIGIIAISNILLIR